MISAPASTGIYTHGIFILGAGFSRAAGLPLGCELWKEVLRRALSMEGKGHAFAMFTPRSLVYAAYTPRPVIDMQCLF